MTNKHLNDEEIQEYVLQKTKCDIDIVTHIQNCKTCKIKAEQYNLLFEGIKQQEKPFFDFNLEELVIEQLPKTRYNDKWISYFIIFITVFSLSMIFYFFRDSLLSLFKGITPIVNALIITTVAALFLFLCIDMYRKYKTQMKALNYY